MPYDAVGSRVRLNEESKYSGALTIGVGLDGLRGAKIKTVPALLVGFKAQVDIVSVQYALTNPAVSDTESPIFSSTLVELTTPKETLTAVAFTQVQVASEAPVKANKALHTQVVAVIPP